MRQKEFRRIIGFVAVEFQRLGLNEVHDPRCARGKRWRLSQVLGACLLGMMAGCTSFAQLERFTDSLSRPIRRKLGIPRRMPDTTMRAVICRLSWRDMVAVLERAIKAARRSKTLERMELPFDMVAMDGKVTWLPSWEGPYAQKHSPEIGLPYGLMRTVTSTLVTGRGCPCIHVSPIPASTNEMGHYPTALTQLCAAYGDVGLVSYDQGASCEANAAFARELGIHYLMRFHDERQHMQQLAAELLATKAAVVTVPETITNRREEVRTLRLFHLVPSQLPTVYRSEFWEHTQTLIAVTWQAKENGNIVDQQTRYYGSSLAPDAITPDQWLWATRAHWRVETTHQITDVSFKEDEKPWIVNDPNGMLVLLVLRRLAYTLLTWFRSVTQRSEEKRMTPWQALFETLRDACIAATEATVAALRTRKGLKPTAILL